MDDETRAAISVMVASDRPQLLAAWSSALVKEPDLRLAACGAVTGESLLSRVARHQPDVLLLDKALLDGMDPAAVGALHAQCPHMRVLLLWHVEGPGVVVAVRLPCAGRR
jgi:DNA-binding NarL/FixJ family response regulator